MSNEESTFFYSGLQWCVNPRWLSSAASQQGVLMFPSTQEKKKISLQLSCSQLKPKGRAPSLGAPIISAACCNKTLGQGAVLTHTQQTDNIIWRQKCPKTEFSAEKRGSSTWAWGTFLTPLGQSDLPQNSKAWHNSLLQSSFSGIPRKGDHKSCCLHCRENWPFSVLSTSWPD